MGRENSVRSANGGRDTLDLFFNLVSNSSAFWVCSRARSQPRARWRIRLQQGDLARPGSAFSKDVGVAMAAKNVRTSSVPEVVCEQEVGWKPAGNDPTYDGQRHTIRRTAAAAASAEPAVDTATLLADHD